MKKKFLVHKAVTYANSKKKEFTLQQDGTFAEGTNITGIAVDEDTARILCSVLRSQRIVKNANFYTSSYN